MKITVEDINTWLLKYEYQTLFLTLDCRIVGDYGFYKVVEASSVLRVVEFNLPATVKLYYNGGLFYDETEDLIYLREGDYQLKVILTINSEDAGGATKFKTLDWFPVSPTKCLSLPYDDLEHRKLFLYIQDSNITSINNKDIKDLGTDSPYVTYGDIASDTVLWSNISDGSRYPFKITRIPSCPHISVEKEFYKGNVNSLDDLITLPSDIEYKIYYNGKELNDTLFIPVDFKEDSIRLRVVTKSYKPYMPVDVYINVPVKTKVLETITDLNNYSYGVINNTITGLNGEINNNIIINCDNNALRDSNLIINAEVVFENLVNLINVKLTNNGYLELNPAQDSLLNIRFTDHSDGFVWVNNGELVLDKINLMHYNGFLLNNGHVKITNSIFRAYSNKNLPIIHSTTNDLLITDNTFQFTSAEGYNGYNICIIRCSEFDANNFLAKNTTNYNCVYTHDDKTYNIIGEGVAYCLIDEDTVRFNNLEVNENV